MNDVVHCPDVDFLLNGGVCLSLALNIDPPQNAAGLGVAAWMAHVCHGGGPFSMDQP
jgi:hypothetical protein